MDPRPTRRRLRLLDLAAIVVAYGIAALLVRAFYPKQGFPNHLAEGLAAFVYTWLGLAMAGPLVLLLDGRSQPAKDEPSTSPKYTWAETAWLLIGGYWLGLALLVVPSRLPISPLLGVFPILAALTVRLFAKKSKGPTDGEPGWTHSLALIVLITWPIAWIGMILLSKTFN